MKMNFFYIGTHIEYKPPNSQHSPLYGTVRVRPDKKGIMVVYWDNGGSSNVYMGHCSISTKSCRVQEIYDAMNNLKLEDFANHDPKYVKMLVEVLDILDLINIDFSVDELLDEIKDL